MSFSRLAKFFTCFLVGFFAAAMHETTAQNPFVTDLFTADPSARVFEGKVYVYPSHDIPCKPGQGFIGFCMADYHVYSSANLTDWKDHGVILDQAHVDWVDSSKYSMWAPDCVYKNGMYYFYFPSISKEGIRRMGVATADKPYGPFKPEHNFIEGMKGIDPNVFIDKDGQGYIYWQETDTLRMAKLNNDMVTLATKPAAVRELPPKFKEGPYLFERNGIYYFTFPHVANKTERLAYATGNNPMGPFEYKGIIMDESPTDCWTNHHSIIEYKGQWYLFYHHNDLSPAFDKNRSILVDSLFFGDDGAIKKVTPSLRGVGLTSANKLIQIDRCSDRSKEGAVISFLDSANAHRGWKVSLNNKGAWVRYNKVDFGSGKISELSLQCSSKKGGKVDIHIDGVNGIVLDSIEIPASSDWRDVKKKLKKAPKGVHDIYLINSAPSEAAVDWLTFR